VSSYKTEARPRPFLQKEPEQSHLKSSYRPKDSNFKSPKSSSTVLLSTFIMGKADDTSSHAVMEATVSHHDTKEEKTSNALQQEHDLTLRDVFKNHKTIVWWCFFWAMAAVGW
jgi:hypothetical protein